MTHYNINIERSLKIIVEFLEDNKIDYMLFGGIALSFYGSPRQTFDIDLKINVLSGDTQKELIQKLRDVAKIIPENVIDFINSTSVLPIEIEGVRIDIVFAHLQLEIDAINKAKTKSFSDFNVKVIKLEDLILHKIISKRQKDWLDVEDLIDKNKLSLDWVYVLKHAKDLADWLDNSDLYNDLVKLKNGS